MIKQQRTITEVISDRRVCANEKFGRRQGRYIERAVLLGGQYLFYAAHFLGINQYAGVNRHRHIRLHPKRHLLLGLVPQLPF